MGSSMGSVRSVGGSARIRMHGVGSITFSNGSGRPCGSSQDGIQCWIRRGAAGMRMKRIGSIIFSHGPGRPSKSHGIHCDQITRGPTGPHINDGSLVRVVGSQRRRRRRTRPKPKAAQKRAPSRSSSRRRRSSISSSKPASRGRGWSVTKIGNRLASRFPIVSYA